jgi:hypothetical protein
MASTMLDRGRGAIASRRAALRQRYDMKKFTMTFTVADRLAKTWELVTFPSTVVFLLWNPRIDKASEMTWPRKVRLARRLLRTTRNVETGTSYKAHLAMATKLLEMPPSVEGVVVECGCYLGGSTANLSIICDAVGRDLIVYDSFEGLPAPEPGDIYATPEGEGAYRGDLEVVQDHVRRFGVLERCTFRKGWFSDTLPHHTEPVALCFLDVDWQSSLHDCIQNLWPKLTDKGYVFIDEYILVDYCSLFFSETYWRTYFDRTPPGLIGAGIGVGVGQYYLGPSHERFMAQAPTSVAFTRKDLSGFWNYYPDRPSDR